MNDYLYGSINDFPQYELSPGQSGADLALWPIQSYNVHYCTFSKNVFSGTNYMNDYIYGSQNDFLLYELLPGQSVGNLVLRPVQNYYSHHCTFLNHI